MKTAAILVRSALAVVFAIVMSSASCDLFDKVDDVTVDVTLTHNFTVNEEEENPDGKAYAEAELLDAAKVNSDFDKYKDKIKSITITEVTYTVQSVATPDVIFTDGYVGFASSSVTATPTQVATLGVENIKAAENQEKNLPFSQAAVDELANLLKNDKKANLFLLGTFSETPAQFNVLVKVKCSITADAL
jgi:hypothetical protein